jgi:transcriptional regulator with XRE-family HTH domain
MHGTSPLLVAFGNNVRTHRKALNLTQQKLGDAANVHRTYIAEIETGDRNVSLLNLAKVAHALGLTLSGLCEGIDRKSAR